MQLYIYLSVYKNHVVSKAKRSRFCLVYFFPFLQIHGVSDRSSTVHRIFFHIVGIGFWQTCRTWISYHADCGLKFPFKVNDSLTHPPILSYLLRWETQAKTSKHLNFNVRCANASLSISYLRTKQCYGKIFTEGFTMKAAFWNELCPIREHSYGRSRLSLTAYTCRTSLFFKHPPRK